ncbi:MAG: DUF6134 family protein [Alphaproteobacteria bacterium]
MAVLLLSAVKPAVACQPPESPARFVIHHETYGDIGTHVLNFSCDGDDLVVDTKVDVKVKVLFVTAYRRKAHYHEVWHGDRLIAYEARTDDDGELFETRARIDGNQMVVDGVEKGVRVPLDTVSSHPWNVRVIDRPLIFGQRDGEIRHVEAEAVGEEPLTIGGKRIIAKKYLVTGDLERELLYAPDGTWLQWRLDRDGKAVTITRQ